MTSDILDRELVPTFNAAQLTRIGIVWVNRVNLNDVLDISKPRNLPDPPEKKLEPHEYLHRSGSIA